jgi:hypothetical protein
MRCPTCGSLVEPERAWKSGSNSFYCGEFCADTEDSQFMFTGPQAHKPELDRQYRERLARLLKLRRSTQPALDLTISSVRGKGDGVSTL